LVEIKKYKKAEVVLLDPVMRWAYGGSTSTAPASRCLNVVVHPCSLN